MNITIYDYDNNQSVVNVPDGVEITEIHVMVLSGDETGYIVLSNDTKIDFDASNTRHIDFDDGTYIVTGERITEWVNFTPSGNGTVSYERQDIFDVWEEDK